MTDPAAAGDTRLGAGSVAALPVSLPPPGSGGAIVHVGCGDGGEWRALLAASDAPDLTLVLVDPNPACQDDLADLARLGPGVQVIAAALRAGDDPPDAPDTDAGPAQEAGSEPDPATMSDSGARTAPDAPGDTAVFHLLTLDDLSGLHGLGGLPSVMPGLRLEERVDVAVLTPAALLAQIAFAGRDNRLVLETLGEEGRVLRALVQEGALEPFGEIAVLVTRAPLFQDGFTADTLERFLAGQGYRPAPLMPDLAKNDLANDLVNDLAANDPDWPRLRFVRDDALRDLVQTRDAAQARTSQLMDLLRTARGDINALRDEARSLEQARDAAAQDRDAAQAHAEDQTAELETLRARLAEIDGQQPPDTAKDTAPDMAQEPAPDVAALQADLGLALRLQALQQADTRELQTRYGALLAQKTRQDTLLAQLTVRLQEASEYLQTLPLDGEAGRSPGTGIASAGIAAAGIATAGPVAAPPVATDPETEATDPAAAPRKTAQSGAKPPPQPKSGPKSGAKPGTGTRSGSGAAKQSGPAGKPRRSDPA